MHAIVVMITHHCGVKEEKMMMLHGMKRKGPCSIGYGIYLRESKDV